MCHHHPVPPESPAFRRVRYSGSDGTTYRTVFEREYGGSGLRDDLGGQSGGVSKEAAGEAFEYTITGDDAVSLRTLDTTGRRSSGTIGARDDHVIFWLTRGSLRIDLGDGQVGISTGAPWVASASMSFRFESVDAAYNGVHIRDGFLREVATELGIALPAGDLVFDQQDDRVAGLAPLRSLMREIGPQFGDNSLSAVARRRLNARIAATVLETFPLRAGGVVVSASRRLRDAVAFVQASAADDVSLADIAGAAGLSDRGVQQLFKRTVGTTPMSYLRDVRLDRVRQQLLDGTEGGVGDVARAWRLNHLGRFAASYRDRFGELPTQTMRARRS